MVRNTMRMTRHQQDQFNVLFVNCLLLKISHILLHEKGSVTSKMLL